MKNTNILIVEDEFIVAKDLQTDLEKLGYPVCGRVNSAEKAIQQLQETGTDLVLMDIMLKGKMTGIEAASEIRSRFHIPVIYVTANTNKHLLEKAKVTEPFGFIVKPFNERELQASIEMALYKHRMEELLRESEEKYRRVVENANESIAVAQDGMLKFFNPKTMEITRYSREELLSKPFIEFIHPEDRDVVLDWYCKRQQAELMPDTYLVRIVRKDRAIRWFEVRAVLIEWERKPATLTFLNDITERKQAEQKLVEQKALLDEVFNGVQEGIALVDEFLNIVFCNPAYANIVEIAHTDLVGRNVFSFFEADARSFLVNEMKVRQKGTISTYELPLVTMRETRKHVRITVAPRLGKDGTLVGEFVTMLDITERKQAEDELNNYETHLEELIE